ncbi:hypothetical protein ACUOA8_59475, partial [Escherichia sp. SS-MK2]
SRHRLRVAAEITLFSMLFVDTAAFGWLAWLVPFYLWRRAKALGQKPAYFWVWLVTLTVTVLGAG